MFAAKPNDPEPDRLDAHSIDWSTIDLLTLTEFERRAVSAMRTSDSMAEAAALADMTVRDLRNRSTRAAAKLARLLLNPRRRAPD